MKWLRSAFKTLINEAVTAELTRQRAVEGQHVSELLSALHKAMDELNHMLSREAMRKARAAAKQLEMEPAGMDQPQQPQLLTPKQAVRARWRETENRRQG